MRPKLIRTELAEYEAAEWDGTDASGIVPVWFETGTALVLVDRPKIKTAGGILLPDDQVDRLAMAAETGVLVGVSATAEDDLRDIVGQRVSFERYAGRMARGQDGKQYRVMSASSLAAVEA